MYAQATKKLGHLVWNGFERLIEAPNVTVQTNTSYRVLAWICYAIVSVLTIGLVYWTLIHLEDIQSLQISDEKALPDIFLCPRSRFSIQIPRVPPTAAEVATEPDEYRVRKVRWRDKALIVKRARKHENYANTVWYNIEVIELLNMTPTHVDLFTKHVRSNAELDNCMLPHIFRPYLTILVEMSRASYAHDLETLESDEMFDVPLLWYTPIHPRLQEQLVLNTSSHNEVQLLWWAIVRTQYVSQYSLQENKTVHYLKSRRFGCLGSKNVCNQENTEPTAVWIDKHYCLAWKPFPVWLVNLYQPDIFDEIQLWTGNIRVQNIEWSDFVTPSIDPRTGWTRLNLTTEQASTNTIQLAQGAAVAYRAFIIQPNANTHQPPTICQRMIDQDANSPSVRQYYCNGSSSSTVAADREYTMYLRMWANTDSAHYSVRVLETERITHQLQFSAWQLFCLVGGAIGLVTGASIQQLMHLLISRFRKKLQLALQITLGICLIILTGLFTCYDLVNSLDSSKRYVTNPFLEKRNDTPIPAIAFGGTTYFSQLTLNHTKLAEYNVSQQLLRYLCIAATAKSCGTDNKIHARDPFEQRERLLNYYEEPFEQLFVVIRPNATLLGEIEIEYVALASAFGVNARSEPAWYVFRNFLLNPCAIVLECKLSERLKSWNCCEEFHLVPMEEDAVTYMMYWPNPKDLTFQDGTFMVYLNTSVYLLHSDGFAPYLGPKFTLGQARRTKWKHNNALELKLGSKNEFASKPIVVTRKITDGMENGDQFSVGLTAKPDKLLSKTQYPESTCTDELKCRMSRGNFVRYRSIERRCPCQIWYANLEAWMIRLNSTKLFCNAMTAVRCLTRNEFYTGYCHNRPSLGIGNFTVPVFKWDSNGTQKYEEKNPNIYLYAHDANYACGATQLWMSEKSPLGGTVSTKDLHTCMGQRSCTRYAYEQVADMTRLTKRVNNPKKGFQLTVSLYESIDPGTQQIDTLDLIAVIGLSMNAFGLFLGLSVVGLIHVLWLIIEPCFKRNVFETAKVESVQHNVNRSPSCTANKGDTAGSTTITVQPLPTEEEQSEKKPGWIHFLMMLVILVAIISLMGVLLRLIPTISQAFVGSYTVHFNETNIEPALAICSTGATESEQRKELEHSAVCAYRGTAMPCSQMFPFGWRRRTHVENVTRDISCVVTTQRLRNSAKYIPISLTQPVYSIKNLQSTTFDRVWFGELSVLYKAEGNQLLFYELSSSTESTKQSFTIKRYRRFSGCEIGTVDLKWTEADEKEKSAARHLQTDFVKENWLSPEINSCESLQYESKARTYALSSVFTQDPTAHVTNGINKTSFELLFDDYVWLDVRQRALYNSGLQLIIGGGYIGQLIGVSALNVLFVASWMILRMSHRITKTVITCCKQVINLEDLS